MSSADNPEGYRDETWGALDETRRRTARIRRRWLAIVGVLVVGYLVLRLGVRLWTEKLWFDAAGYSIVFRNELLAKGGMFSAGFVLTAGLVWASIVLAYRHRPFLAPSSVDLDSMERYRALIEPARQVAFGGAPILIGLFGGTVAASQWKTFLLWWNRVDFGVRDPNFGRDIGFFVFSLPWWQLVTSLLTMALVFALVAGVVVHYIYGGISLTREPGSRFTAAARVHLSIAAAGLVLVRAATYWLDRYALTTKDSRLITGIDYTADHAQIPTKTVLAVAALLCAALFVATIWTRTWRLPVIALASMVVLTIALSGVYPMIINNFKVKPNARALESPYIARNIQATKQAYGLQKLVVTNEQPETDAKPTERRKDAAAIPGIRLVDPYLISPTFRQEEGQKQYYQFADVLDVDRYGVDGRETDVVVGVRELDLSGIPAGQRNWVNEHTVYTHGYGMVGAAGNQRGEDGKPVFVASKMPQDSDLGQKFEPRVYFGEMSPSYSIVGAPAGSQPSELDYPDSSTGGERRTTYQGNGGVALGGFFRKALYAVKYQEYNFLFSDSLNDKSRILDVRNPADRVKKVAPWLTVDGDPYPIVADGRIKWVIDGYTTSARYPYSQMALLDETTEDSITNNASNVRSIKEGSINYIRNSVKATVDAYDGSIKMYAWDEQDPVLKVWRASFGGTILPLSQMPADVRSHVRYPEDLFKVQREILGKYHVSDPATFFSGTDFWQVPADPTRAASGQQPPYYLSIAMPGVDRPTYSLTTSYIPVGSRQNLSAFLSVDSDATPRPGAPNGSYGTMRLWTMPRNVTIKGPAQFQNDVNTSNEASTTFPQTLSVFMQANGDRLQRGNLLTLPLAGGLLYVQPIYVKASGTTGFPLQRAVVVQFGEKLAWGVTLENALDDLFGASGDSGSEQKPPTQEGDTATKALDDAQKAWDRGQAALKKGDLAGYQKAMNEMKAALDRAVRLQKPEPTATPSPSSSSTTSPAA